MDEMRITQTRGFVWMKWAWLAINFFWNYFFCGNKDSLNRYTRSNRQYLPTYRKPRLVAHTLDPPLHFVLPRLLSA